jgi:hypothetical protein
MAMPSMHAVRVASITLRSMNAPGSPSSPLQMTYLMSPGLGNCAPLEAGGITAAAASAEAALSDLVNHAVGRHLVRAVRRAW